MAYRKTLVPEISSALNEQVTVEAKAAFLYYSMASWADVQGLTGFASWFRSEAAGELDHMRQFVEYLNDRDFQATFGEIAPPASNWENVAEAFSMVRDNEHELCDRIDKLIGLAHKHSDHLSDSFLHQFVPQQIADTAEVDDVHDRLQLVAGDGHGIILIDQELAGKAEAP